MLKSFLRYLKNPLYVYVPYPIKFIKFFGVIGKLILIYFCFIFLSTHFILIPLSVFELLPDHKAMNLPLTFKILILVPFYEELVFRLPMRFSLSNLFIAIGTLSFLVISKITNIYIGSLSGLLIILIPNLNILHVNLKLRIRSFYLINYKFLFYFLTFSFGILHLLNFQNLELIHYFISPLLVVNQIFMGFILGFARTNYKFGFLFSFLIHAGINAVIILPKNLL